MTLHVDFEVRSAIDLKEAGMFRYAEDSSTQALILAYSIGESPVVGVDLTKGRWHEVLTKLAPVFEAIQKGMTFCAHNAQFERLIWTKVCRFPVTPQPGQWDCTAARARMLAIPGGLDGAAAAVGVPIRKDERGTELINFFCKPRKGDGRFHEPSENPDRFQAFIDYCKNDVEVERSLDRVLPPLSDVEAAAWELDYKINNTGIKVNMDLVNRAADFVDEYSEKLLKKAVAISGCRPTQREKTLEFLASRGVKLPNLQAPTVEACAKRPGLPPDIVELLDHRIELSRAGTKKLKAIQSTVCEDGRIRGGFLFSAASTRRWSSTGVQLHNLQKPEGECNPEVLFQLLMSDPDALPDLFDRPLTALAQSIRGFFESEEDLLIADYSSVEPKGLAWLSGEEWILEAYRAGQDLYKLMASRVYGMTVEEVDKFYRFMGKQLVLGCGYGMGPPRFIETCAKFNTIIDLTQSQEAVYGYRNSVPNITKFWRTMEQACIRAVKDGRTIKSGKLVFRPASLSNGYKLLYVDMPSGTICYPGPSVGKEVWNGENRDTFEFYTPLGSNYVKIDTFGGSLVENVTQALTRDILRDGLLAADKAGHKIVAHVHDEGIAEGKGTPDALADFSRCLTTSSPWAKGFPISTDGQIAKRYQK